MSGCLLRRIEIIGEAERHISPHARRKYPQIPWREMTTLRNLVIHKYDGDCHFAPFVHLHCAAHSAAQVSLWGCFARGRESRDV